MTDYQNYLSGSDPTYANAMARPQAPAQTAAAKPMTMEEWQRYLAMLTPEEQQAVHAAAINWGAADAGGQGGIQWGKKGKGGEGGGNPMEKIMGMFGGGGGGP